MGYQEEPGRDYRAERDAAYVERNKVVAGLAAMVLRAGGRAWLADHRDVPDEDWDPEWRTVVFIDGPTGQLSWHLHDSDVVHFLSLPRGENEWDGHTSEAKYSRIAQLAIPAPQPPADATTTLCKAANCMFQDKPHTHAAGPPVTAPTGDDYNGFWPLAVRIKEDFDRLVNTARSDEWKRVIGNVRDWVQEADRDEQPRGATLLGLAEALGTDTSYLLGTTRTFEQIVDAVGTLPTTGLAAAGPPVTGDGDETVVREIANRWTKEWSGSEGRTRMPGPDAIANAVREAIARGRELGEREDELMLFLAESVRDAFECDCEFEGDTCPCEGDGNDDEGCWRCQANAAIEARRAGRGTL